ncbi:MAG: argininosuccinate lyase [Actinomycetales bacterium]
MALWGGRFTRKSDEAMFTLSKSTDVDWELAPYDIAGSLAHLAELEKGKLVSKEIAIKIREELQKMLAEVRNGSLSPLEDDEDVHSALERILLERVGQDAGKIRAGRSRNDQVATDFKLYLLDHMVEVSIEITKLVSAILVQAEKHLKTMAPGFTHLQHAQPVTFGQELSKHAFALERDLDRIEKWFERSNSSPLGAGALSGTSLPISPESTAKGLGFSGPVLNSIDAVSDRDFAAEALFILALIGVHLSRIGEEWTIWSTSEFGWAILDDAFATGSSIMPQKKNPDIAELARGKAGPLIGNLVGLLTTLKGLPFAYNRDLQEDKALAFSSIHHLLTLLPAVTGMVATTKFDVEKMRAAAPLGFSLATEIADFLVRKGIPFPEAHDAAGKCVQISEKSGVTLEKLSDSDFKSAHPALDASVRSVLNLDSAIDARSSINGTSPNSVLIQIKSATRDLARHEKWISDAAKRFSGMMSQ